MDPKINQDWKNIYVLPFKKPWQPWQVGSFSS
jgi:hypothetical protein